MPHDARSAPSIEQGCCPVHGPRYCPRGVSVCVHPRCLSGLLTAYCQHHTYIRIALSHLRRKQLFEDLLQFLALRVLEDAAAQKPMLISPMWVKFELSNFERRRYFVPRKENTFPQPLGDDIPKSWEQALQDHFKAIDPNASTERAATYREVERKLRTDGQDVLLLLLRGDINPSDAWLLERKSRNVKPFDAHAAHEFSRQWFAAWASHHG